MATLRLIMITIVLAMAPLFFVGGPSAIDPPTIAALYNLGHVAFFALSTALVWLFLAPGLRRRPGWIALLATTFSVLVMGVLIEGVQARFARDPDWHDVWRNLVGVWLAWFLVIRPPTRLLIGGQLVVCALLAFEATLVWQTFAGEWQLQRRVPLIADFEDPREGSWSQNSRRSDRYAAHGRYSLQVDLDTGTYSGTAPRRFPGDWRGYAHLAFDLYNPEPDSLRLTLLVGDRDHYRDGYRYENRYNGRVWAAPGWTAVRIRLADIAAAPRDRALDLGEVVSLGLFATRLPAPRVIYLDHVRLE